MRVKLFLLALTLVFMTAPALMPGMVCAAVPAVSYVRCCVREYARETEVSGVLEQEGIQEVYLSAPVIASQVLVSPGERVKEGETLAMIDEELTQTVLSQSILVEKEGVSEPAQISDESLELLSQAASLYGAKAQELVPLLQKAQESAIRDVEAPGERTLAVPTQILSPMDGVVMSVEMKSGVLTQPDGAVFTLAQDGQFSMCASVAESLIQGIEVGDSAVITGEGMGEKSYPGVVTAIAPVAQRGATAGEQASVEVTITLTGADEQLRHQLSANAVITSQHSRTLCTLPYEAIRQDEGEQEYVLIVRDGRAVKQPVTTGEELNNCVEIVSGAPQGAVIVDPKIEAGDRVRLGEETLG